MIQTRPDDHRPGEFSCARNRNMPDNYAKKIVLNNMVSIKHSTIFLSMRYAFVMYKTSNDSGYSFSLFKNKS